MSFSWTFCGILSASSTTSFGNSSYSLWARISANCKVLKSFSSPKISIISPLNLSFLGEKVILTTTFCPLTAPREFLPLTKICLLNLLLSGITKPSPRFNLEYVPTSVKLFLFSTFTTSAS